MPARELAPLMLFARAPVAGRVKTRLARAIGDEAAARLYAAFLDDVIAVARSIDRAAVELWAASAADAGALTDRYPQFECHVQCAGDLGARMEAALARGVARAGRAAVLGTDLPTLPRAALDRALALLDVHDAVLGPTTDGGYWIVGVRSAVPDLAGARWSSPHALEDTRARLAGLDVALAPASYDVDEAGDLERVRRDLEADLDLAPSTRAALALFDRG